MANLQRQKEQILAAWRRSRESNTSCKMHKIAIRSDALSGLPARIYEFLEHNGGNCQYVRITQTYLAEILNVSVAAVNQTLINLSVAGIIDFMPTRPYAYRILNTNIGAYRAELCEMLTQNGDIQIMEV